MHAVNFENLMPMPFLMPPQLNTPKNRELTSKTGEVGGNVMEKSKHRRTDHKPREKAIKFSKVERVPYTSAEAIESKLKPGDILLSYYPKNVELVDVVIRGGQKLTKLYTKTPTKESHNFVHASLYTGKGKISEAIKEGLVSSELSGDRFRLEPGMVHGFLVVRPKNERMATQAAMMADNLAAHGDTEATYKYSIGKALFSSFHGSDLDEKAVKRYLKGAAYAHNGIQPMSKHGIREFFCSYFVGWACQAGESLEVIEKINSRLPKDEQIKFPDLSKVPEEKRGKKLEKWARKVAHEHYDLFREHIKLKMDPKWASPQRLYGFILEHPDLFTQEMLIVAPPSEEKQDQIRAR